MENLSVLTAFNFSSEAQMAKAYLEANGIETVLKDETTVQVNGFYSQAIGGVKIVVKDSDYEKGIKILKDGGYISDPNSKKSLKIETITINHINQAKTCPFCQSKNISRKKNLSILAIPLSAIIAAPFPLYKFKYVCFDCEKEWKFKLVKSTSSN